ncbi:MAG: MFS transporter [Rhodospirillaceae bacterium]|nr:MFS transporter [Rhodospirillaceae bacterium]
MTDAPTGRRASSLRQRDFRLLIIGKTFGWMALHMMMVAITYQVYDRTGDVMNLAYIGLATFAPAIGFALITGYVADRFDRRLVLVVTYGIIFVGAVLLYLYTASGMEAVWPVFAILALEGTGRAFHQPAVNSLVPNLVPAESFPNAVAWHSTINKITQMVGPALGGILYLAGPEIVYVTAAAGLLIALIMTAFIRTRTEIGQREPKTFATLLAGLRYVYNKKIIFGAITLDMMVVLLGGVTALFPVFAKDILDAGSAGAGFLRSAMAGGALVSGIMLTQITLERWVGKIMFGTVVVFGICTIAFGLSDILWVSLLAMAILGATDMVSVNICSTLMQIATPNEMRGRVSAVSSVFTGASNEIGEFRAGAMAAAMGAVPAVLVGGVGSLLVAAVCWRAFPQLAKVERFDQDL